MGISYALYDEGSFRNELKGWDAANMEIAPESLRAVNNALSKENQIDRVELGKYYGSKEENNLRVVFNEKLLHPFQPYNKEATANQINYFEKVFGFPNKLNAYNQIWQFKELFTLINMVVSLLMLIPLTKVLLQLNFFKVIIKPIPAALPRQSNKSRLIFWIIFFCTIMVACILFMNFVVAEASESYNEVSEVLEETI